MSGGSRNYAYCIIENELCGRMYDAEINDLMDDVAKLAHDVEWFDSSDINEEVYRKTVNEFKKKWFGLSREERLKEYLDKTMETMKKEFYMLLGVSEE